jgi:putative FmdB family regulatory protein
LWLVFKPAPARRLSARHAAAILSAMPIYEFHCDACDTDSEVLVRSSKWEGTPCPQCGSTKLRKKFSTFASSSGATEAAPVCTGQPKSCGLCGTGRPHAH